MFVLSLEIFNLLRYLLAFLLGIFLERQCCTLIFTKKLLWVKHLSKVRCMWCFEHVQARQGSHIFVREGIPCFVYDTFILFRAQAMPHASKRNFDYKANTMSESYDIVVFFAINSSRKRIWPSCILRSERNKNKDL